MSNSSRSVFGTTVTGLPGSAGLTTSLSNSTVSNSYSYPPISGSAIPRQQYMAFTYWSSVDIPRNAFPRSSLYLFNTCLNNKNTLLGGNRVPSIADTNMRESSRLNHAFLCTHIKWLLVPTPESDGNLEKLAEAQDPVPDDPAREMCSIMQNTAIQWDFTQTLIDIAPLWIGETEQNIVIPELSTFMLRLSFSPGLPELIGKYTLRAVISGQGPTPGQY